MKLEQIIAKSHGSHTGHEGVYGFDKVIAKVRIPRFSFSYKLSEFLDNFGIPYKKITKLISEDPKSWMFKEKKTYSYYKKVLTLPWGFKHLIRGILYKREAFELHCPKCGRNKLQRVNWYESKECDDELFDKCSKGHKFAENDAIVVPIAFKGL